MRWTGVGVDRRGFAAELADTTPPKWFQKKESPFKVTDLWVEAQKLSALYYYPKTGNAKSTSVAKCFFHSYTSNCLAYRHCISARCYSRMIILFFSQGNLLLPMCRKSTTGANWQFAVQIVCLGTYRHPKILRFFLWHTDMHVIVSHAILE